jgi:hypothetical protein
MVGVIPGAAADGGRAAKPKTFAAGERLVAGDLPTVFGAA